MFLFNQIFSYIIFSSLLILSYFSLFIQDLMTIWFFLEISNLFFIYMLNIFMKNKKLIFLYFTIQITSSSLMIFSIIINNFILFNNHIFYIMFISLMIKLNLPPFHFWLPLISKFLPLNMLLILISIQKIIPFYIISLTKLNNLLIFYMILILCSILPPFMCLNITNFKMIMSYSSINQSSWMMLMIYTKTFSWLLYFIFYSVSILSLTFMLLLFKMSKNFHIIPLNINFNLMFLFIIFNLAGLPPFSMFLIKWYSIFLFMSLNNLLFIMILMMISSLFMLFIYNNMLFFSLFLFKMESKLIKMNHSSLNYTIYLYFLFPLILSSLILMI